MRRRTSLSICFGAQMYRARERKRKVLVFASGYRSHHKYYLDRGGVETLAILYGQQPRAEIMASLRGP